MGGAIDDVRARNGATADPASAPVVVLAHARSATERELIERWVTDEHPGAPVLRREDPELAARLEREDDPELVPVRVTWVPREREGSRNLRPTDLLALTHPRRPPAVLQARIARREPDRVHVVAGEGARLSALRRRFREHSGPRAGARAFGAFVARQALLACDRADRAIIGDRYKVPRLVAEQITASARFRAEVEELAEHEGRPPAEVMAEAEVALRELATVQSPPAIDAFRLLLSPMHARAYDVETDTEGLERLRALNRRHALVFLPTHRAYTDPLVLAEVLHEHDFPRNHLLGGNNLAFWPIGPLGKRAGLIFIRRSFGDDPVYKLAVREFLGHLVAKRFNIEWYIEGGRSRTGKLRPPKYGLLHYLAMAVEKGRAEDVMLVPVSINYSRLHEVAKMAAEQRGQEKSAEGLAWLAGYMRAQTRRVGRVRLDFGEPISLAGALSEAGEGRARLEKVAFRICDGINRVTPMTSPSLVTLAVLGTPGRALTLEQVSRILEPKIDYVLAREIPGDVEGLRDPSALKAALAELVTAGVLVCYDGGTEPVWSIAPGSHVSAAFYRNAGVHHFIVRAVLELALLHAAQHPESGDLVEDAWQQALRVRDLLKFEFFFAEKEVFRAELGAELDRLDPRWRDGIKGAEEAGALLRESRVLVANRALRSFFDAQLVVAERLAARDPEEEVEEDAFLAECLGVGRQMLLQGRLHSAESVSRELFASALKLARNRELVEAGGAERRRARQAFYEEICDVVTLTEEIRRLDEAVIQEVLDARLP